MNNLKGYFFFISAIILVVFYANGCTEEEPELTTSNRILADSILRTEIRFVIEEVDSLCQLTYQSTFDKAVDSISEVRLKEIEKYIPTR
ncbi:hypothetical protein [Portibacter marinus]|uniref:hypothetical protein n=1 Tax=Portibacter marinus TaxID=2898660 RepID=UPI001F304C5D|nr:hypothetical protein [Portibacter marinus]